MWENMLFVKSGHVASITINRPQALNALNAPVLKELEQILTLVEKDEEVRVVILTGSGDKAFVAGADISFMKNFNSLEGRAFALLGQEAMNKVEKFTKPVIAAINGFALGGGCELAMACDIRIASEKAKFGQPEVGLGIIPGFAGTQRLPRLVGKGIAKELIFTGNIINAHEALRIGLVNKVVPPEELMTVAQEMALTIANKAPLAVRLAKLAINEGLEMEVDKSMAHEANYFGLCFGSEDQKEGMAAFLEKRPAQFKNK